MPDIDIAIDSLPMLETGIGLFGSVAEPLAHSGPGLLDLIVTILLILYD